MAFGSSRSHRSRVTPGAGLTLRFWGVRGSVAVPGPSTVRYGGNTACVEARYGRDIMILDAGTGIRELGRRLVREFDGKPHRVSILITHTHWDHIRIIGARGSRAGLRRTVVAAVESPFFPVALREMPGSITVEQLSATAFRIGKVRVETALLNHPGGGVGFRLNTPDGSVAYIPDHEVPCPPAALDGAAPPPAPPGRSALRRVRAMRDLARGADILVHDAQYTAREYARRVGWGHSCMEGVVRNAVEDGVGRLILFHHDPNRDDNALDAMLEDARKIVSRLKSPLRVDAGREGMELLLIQRKVKDVA
jgi:phosphoribosyl 1,2-cyclic phosphodiesterase